MDVKAMNMLLLKPNSTIEASKKLDSTRIMEITHHFNDFDPYVQSIWIQSVAFLSEAQFAEIKDGYQQLLQQASKSTNDWVLSTYEMFKDYPHVNTSEKFEVNIPPRNDGYVDPFIIPQFTPQQNVHFTTKAKLMSPSDYYALQDEKMKNLQAAQPQQRPNPIPRPTGQILRPNMPKKPPPQFNPANTNDLLSRPAPMAPPEKKKKRSKIVDDF